MNFVLVLDYASDSWGPGHLNFDDFKGDVTKCGGCSQPFGMADGRIPDFAITASSWLDWRNEPQNGRLYSSYREGDEAYGWSPRQNVVGEWLQVDLGTVVMVTKIATQGSYSYMEWVIQYSIEYSENGTEFQQHENKELLTDTSDENTIIGNNLSPPIRGQFIRIYSRLFCNFITLRIELYGCPP